MPWQNAHRRVDAWNWNEEWSDNEPVDCRIVGYGYFLLKNDVSSASHDGVLRNQIHQGGERRIYIALMSDSVVPFSDVGNLFAHPLFYGVLIGFHHQDGCQHYGVSDRIPNANFYHREH